MKVTLTSLLKKRLPQQVISFIKESNGSYRTIKEAIKINWNITVPKSTVSYYKRSKPRLKPLSLTAISAKDWQWLQGLFSADGNKMISQDKSGPHYVVRISLDNTNDLLIADKCIRIIRAIGLTPNKLLWVNCLTIKVSSKHLYNALSKTVDKSSVTAAYIAGAIDGDGWVDHRAIQFGQSHIPELFDAILGYFTERNINLGIWTKSDEPKYRRMYIPLSVLSSTGILINSIKAQRI